MVSGSTAAGGLLGARREKYKYSITAQAITTVVTSVIMAIERFFEECLCMFMVVTFLFYQPNAAAVNIALSLEDPAIYHPMVCIRGCTVLSISPTECA